MNPFPNILGEILNIEEKDNDDLDMLYAATRRSERFSQGRIRRHHGSVVNYIINGHEYRMRYYLADGIYPNWSTFIKTIPCPQGLKKKHFAKAQESARKDVERAFWVLQARFSIVRGPTRFWDEETLVDIMKACIIMHNMVIEDEGDIGNDEAFFQQELGWSMEGSLGWTRIVGRLGCRFFELSELR